MILDRQLAAGPLAVGVAKLTGFEYIFRRNAKIGDGGRKTILFWNTFRPALGDLAALLRGIIFIRKPHLGAAFDQECVGLNAMGGSVFIGRRATSSRAR